MDLLAFVAHGDEPHHTTSALHFAFGHWYIDLPLLFLVMAAMVWLAYRLSHRSVAVAFLTASGCLLVSGLTLFQLYPAVSTAAISIGLGTTLVCVLLSLQNAPARK